jgi:hypothetical protein
VLPSSMCIANEHNDARLLQHGEEQGYASFSLLWTSQWMMRVRVWSVGCRILLWLGSLCLGDGLLGIWRLNGCVSWPSCDVEAE